MFDHPQLTVFAGCNGSGKSSFSKSLVPTDVLVFDFDKEKKNQLDRIQFDFEFSEEIAHQRTTDLFESLVEGSIHDQRDFSYETNFNYNPLKWPTVFKNAGYKVNLVFFMLDTIEKAKERVAIRVENGGHFVNDSEIENRFIQGYENLDLHFTFFDQIQLFDTSEDGKPPRQISFIRNEAIEIYADLPDHLLKNGPALSQWMRDRSDY